MAKNKKVVKEQKKNQQLQEYYQEIETSKSPESDKQKINNAAIKNRNT